MNKQFTFFNKKIMSLTPTEKITSFANLKMPAFQQLLKRMDKPEALISIMNELKILTDLNQHIFIPSLKNLKQGRNIG